MFAWLYPTGKPMQHGFSVHHHCCVLALLGCLPGEDADAFHWLSIDKFLNNANAFKCLY
jgi:hypothetical protein